MWPRESDSCGYPPLGSEPNTLGARRDSEAAEEYPPEKGMGDEECISGGPAQSTRSGAPSTSRHNRLPRSFRGISSPTSLPCRLTTSHGFFERADIEALLAQVEDDGIRDFIAWGFRTGMRKREIARLTWDMLDRTGSPWVPRIPGPITKNRAGRALGLEGEVRAIVERRLKTRRSSHGSVPRPPARGGSGRSSGPGWTSQRP
jgi:integrase